MSLDIYYYSGTGNSLQVARELQRLLPGSRLVPIASLLDQDRVVATASALGFVFPVYVFGLPEPLRSFLGRVELGAAGYLFALATRGGSPCRVFEEIDSILKKKGRALDARAFVNMPTNAVGIHPLDSPEEIESKEAEMRTNVEAFARTVLEKRSFRPSDPHGSFVKERVLLPPLRAIARSTRYGGAERRFFADERCTGCGICAEVCLTGRIVLSGGHPVWLRKERCHFCLACLNWCPTKAIQNSVLKTSSKGRYHHAEIEARDIAAQKASEA